jgi:hypothetical protein
VFHVTKIGSLYYRQVANRLNKCYKNYKHNFSLQDQEKGANLLEFNIVRILPYYSEEFQNKVAEEDTLKKAKKNYRYLD